MSFIIIKQKISWNHKVKQTKIQIQIHQGIRIRVDLKAHPKMENRPGEDIPPGDENIITKIGIDQILPDLRLPLKKFP